MIRFLRGSGAGPVFVLILASLGLWGEYFLSPPRPAETHIAGDMPLWAYISGALEGSPFIAVIVSFLLVLTLAIVLVRFNISIFFIPRRTVLPALLFLLLYSVFPGEMVFNPALPASLLIIAALWRMISSYRVNGMSFKFFDAALMISSAGLLYAGSVWFILIVFICALILRTPDFRELVLAVTGALLPWIVMYAVWYVTGGDPGELTETISTSLFGEAPSVYWSRTLVILLIVTGFLFLSSLVYLAREMPTYKIRSRKTYEILIWVLVICAAAYIFIPAVSAELMAVAAIPVSFIIANYMAFTRRTVTAEIFFWIMVIMIVVARVWPY